MGLPAAVLTRMAIINSYHLALHSYMQLQLLGRPTLPFSITFIPLELSKLHLFQRSLISLWYLCLDLLLLTSWLWVTSQGEQQALHRTAIIWPTELGPTGLQRVQCSALPWSAWQIIMNKGCFIFFPHLLNYLSFVFKIKSWFLV